MKIIITHRLLLREMTPEDADNLYQLNLDPEVIRYTGDPPFDSILDAKNFLNRYNHYQKYGFGRWAVIRKLDNAFLGWCGLKYSPDLNEYDIGYRFMKKYWSQGFATESATACIKWAFEKSDITEIIGRADIKNEASYKVLEKIGLSYWKLLQTDNIKLLIYKIDRSDYYQK